jgi:threonyl-tRNA synthetase
MVDVSGADSTLSKKVRQAEQHGYHYILILGEEEASKQVINVRTAGSVNRGIMSVDELAAEFKKRDIELS